MENKDILQEGSRSILKEGGENMKKDRAAVSKEAKRLEQVKFIMEHWDELPERLQGRFEGIIAAVNDLSTGDDKPRKAG